MLQRVGLAQALLGHPRYLFLDEPASGVDPAGVVLFRRLLGDLKGSGATVLLNSHQLDQVERVCDRVAFVKGGRVEAIETLAAGATVARVVRVRWAVGGAVVTDAALTQAAGQAGAALVSRNNAEARFSVPDDAGAARLMASLVAAGVPVSEVTPEESRLERLFLDDAPRRGAGSGGGAATGAGSVSGAGASGAPPSAPPPPGGGGVS